ncbi:FCD domain-containing protein [Streptomyces sp. NBC_00056]|uniref:FCD domain-containing protein n=1 Tax=unclassified Streptomyces TaxID=2593676 RepID=UPI00225B7F90|nr:MULTISPECIES: FCD domain-containing protein [unclassified Streptomyces]MCX5442701.1 FCD domain-containing protein [Streptomyces sp. NBC_00063]WUB91110.1 FCD domain-containing protein [Streptomyces sp. NBC_00569]
MSCHTPATEWCRPFALAARAAAKVAPDEIAQLEVILDEHQNAIAADDSERVADLGHAFHHAINQAADSHRLALLLKSVVKNLPNRFYATIEGRVSATRTKHLCCSTPCAATRCAGRGRSWSTHPRGRRPPDRGP